MAGLKSPQPTPASVRHIPFNRAQSASTGPLYISPEKVRTSHINDMDPKRRLTLTLYTRTRSDDKTPHVGSL